MAGIDRAKVIAALAFALDSYRRGVGGVAWLLGFKSACHHLKSITMDEGDAWFTMCYLEYEDEHRANKANPLPPTVEGRAAAREQVARCLDAARVADK